MNNPDENLPATANDKRRFLLPVLLLLGLVVGTFAHVVRQGFVDWDDPIHIIQNPNLLPITPEHLAAFWRAPYEGLYAPVAYMAFAALSAIGQLPAPISAPCGGMTTFNATVFHIANLSLHCLNTLLVYALLCRIARKEWSSFAGAVLFAVHPLQVESVAWISELRGLLGAAFSLAALHAYLSFAGSPSKSRQRSAWYCIASAMFVAALLSKPSTVTLPLIAVALEWCIHRKPIRTSLLPLFPWCLAGIACLLVTRTAQAVDAGVSVPFLARFAVAGDAVGFYLAKLIAPVSLAIDYGRTPHFALQHPGWIEGGAASILLSLAAYRFRDKHPILATAWLVFLAALLPVLGFVPFVFQSFSTTADRYMYIAMLGPALAISSLLASMRPQAARMAAALMACCLAPVAAVQIHTWDDSFTLFTHALAVNPQSSPMHADLGRVYSFRGDLANATRQYDAALRIDPRNATAHYNLATVYAAEQHLPQAEVEYRTAIALRPVYAEAYCNLGGLFASEGRFNDALNAYRTAATQQPSLTVAQQGITAVEAAMREDPPGAAARGEAG